MCINNRVLNTKTIKDRTPLPNLVEIRDRLVGEKVLTKLDLRNGYYNIHMEEESKKMTAFNSPMGHFEFNVMNFGLTNAPATFM